MTLAHSWFVRGVADFQTTSSVILAIRLAIGWTGPRIGRWRWRRYVQNR